MNRGPKCGVALRVLLLAVWVDLLGVVRGFAFYENRTISIKSNEAKLIDVVRCCHRVSCIH